MRYGWVVLSAAAGAAVGALLAAWAEGSWRRPQVVEFGAICAACGGLISLLAVSGWLY